MPTPANCSSCVTGQGSARQTTRGCTRSMQQQSRSGRDRCCSGMQVGACVWRGRAAQDVDQQTATIVAGMYACMQHVTLGVGEATHALCHADACCGVGVVPQGCLPTWARSTRVTP